MSNLKNQRVLVVGGRSGIGYAVAEAALAQGAEVIIASRNMEKLEAAKTRLGGKTSIAQVDATDPASVQAMLSKLGAIDHMVVTTHDSGDALSGAMRLLEEIDLDQAAIYFKSRFWAKFICTKFAVPHLSSHGSIVLTSGVVARGYVPNHSLLAGNNSAVEAFARKVAVEIGPKRINVISPGLTQGTETYDNVPDAALEGMIKHFEQKLPVKFVATARDIAPSYLFCMTNRYMTGVFIDVDGGFNVWNPEQYVEGAFSAE